LAQSFILVEKLLHCTLDPGNWLQPRIKLWCPLSFISLLALCAGKLILMSFFAIMPRNESQTDQTEPRLKKSV
jgi:hypothetical protein